MIITRTPLRIPIGGGGTDLPTYYSRYGGFFISAAMNKYVYIVVNSRFEPDIRVSYSKTEIVRTPEEVQHPIVREALKMLDIRGGIEIVSIADLPANTGLGSSGAFTVGLLLALHTFKRERVTPQDLAEEAFKIEVEILKEPIGKQDQYIAAFGGITCFEVDKDGRVEVTPLRINSHKISELESDLLLFYTGIKRSASEVLVEQKKAVEDEETQKTQLMHEVKRIGLDIRAALEAGEVNRFGELMDVHWNAKKKLSGKISSPEIDDWYDSAKANGAIGGKIMGAGGGGFFLFHCGSNGSKGHVREALTAKGLSNLRFNFDFEGSKVLVNI